MKQTLILNASPRNNGTAHMLCMRLQAELGGKYQSLYGIQNTPSSILENIIKADTIVLVGPCYVNSFPGTVTELFEYLSHHQKALKNKVWYGIIEGGMPYTHTHESGLKHLSYFCNTCGMSYNGGFILTMAPLLNGKPLEKHIASKKILPAFNQFVTAIKYQAISPDSLYQNLESKMSLITTKCLSLFLSSSIDKSLKQHGFDPKAPSPYSQNL